MTLVRDLLPPAACGEARAWLGRRRNPAKAYRECERGDWLLWLHARKGSDRKLLVLAACDCVRLALKHVPEGEDRPRRAIEAAEAWTRGEVALDEVRRAAAAAYAAAAAADAAAAYAAYAAAYAAAAAAAYAAAYADAYAYAAAAAYAAYAADAAAYAADSDAAYAYAADAAAYAAAYAAAADAAARTSTLKACADLVRARFPEAPA